MADRSAQLQRGTFPSYRSTHQMGYRRCDKDQRRHTQGHRLITLNRGDDKIGPSLCTASCPAVKEKDQNGSEGKQQQKLRMRSPQPCHIVYTLMKKCSDHSDQKPT